VWARVVKRSASMGKMSFNIDFPSAPRPRRHRPPASDGGKGGARAF
jgi:hypothetical protein